MLLKVFDAEFPYKRSYFEPLYLHAKMGALTVIRSIPSDVNGTPNIMRSSFRKSSEEIFC